MSGQGLRDQVLDRLKELDQTQAYLARMVGVSEKHLSQVMNGHVGGSLPLWESIAKALGLRLTLAAHPAEPAPVAADTVDEEREHRRWISSDDRRFVEQEALRRWPEALAHGRWDGVTVSAERALLIQRHAFEMGAEYESQLRAATTGTAVADETKEPAPVADMTSIGLTREEIRSEVDELIRNAYYAAWRESRRRPHSMAPGLEIDWTQPGGVQVTEQWGDEAESEPAPIANRERVAEVLAAWLDSSDNASVNFGTMAQLPTEYRALAEEASAALAEADVFRDEAAVKAEALREAAAAWDQADRDGSIGDFADKHYHAGLNLPSLWLHHRAGEPS